MIQTLRDLKELGKSGKIILLYSGGLDSTYLLAKLGIKYGYNVVALKVGIGNIDEEIYGNWNRSNISIINHDGRGEFIENYISKSIKNGGKYLGNHILSASLSRPFLADVAMRFAETQKSEIIVHSATSHQNSMRRFNQALCDLGFQGVYGSPFALEEVNRSDKKKFLENLGIIVPEERKLSIDSNLWVKECEGESPFEVDNLSLPLEFFDFNGRSATEDIIELTFEKGELTCLNSERLGFENILNKLDELGKQHQIGFYISLEENPCKEKMLEIRKAPGAEIIQNSYWNLASKVLDHETLRIKNNMDQLWAREASEGRWFGILKSGIESFNESISNRITGTIRMKLFQGNIFLEGIYKTGIQENKKAA